MRGSVRACAGSRILALAAGVATAMGWAPPASGPLRIHLATAAHLLAPGAASATTPKRGAAPALTLRGVEGTIVDASLDSKSLGGKRKIDVLLPPAYESSVSQRYAVLYALDGQNLFSDSLAAGGEEWALDELLARRPAYVQPLLVVAIRSGPDAVNEYAPPGSTPGARGDACVDFLVNELKPAIDARFRTRPEREATYIMGQGGSAVLAVFAAWRRAEVFRGAIALEFPDVDAETTAWTAGPPANATPWIWFEQVSASRPRASTTALIADLRQAAQVQVLVSGPRTPRPERLLAALRALPIQ
jgi:enterochelin esterase-like enzyme